MKPTTGRQEEEFVRDVIGLGLLEESLKWIRSNLDPEDVFSEERLSVWAKHNYQEE